VHKYIGDKKENRFACFSRAFWMVSRHFENFGAFFKKHCEVSRQFCHLIWPIFGAILKTVLLLEKKFSAFIFLRISG